MAQLWLAFSVWTWRVVQNLRAERGQTMAEYALLLGVIALVVAAVAVLLGKSISSVFSDTAGRV